MGLYREKGNEELLELREVAKLERLELELN